jgi:hypothetical protein
LMVQVKKLVKRGFSGVGLELTGDGWRSARCRDGDGTLTEW